jgi:hypothetical protein
MIDSKSDISAITYFASLWADIKFEVSEVWPQMSPLHTWLRGLDGPAANPNRCLFFKLDLGVIDLQNFEFIMCSLYRRRRTTWLDYSPKEEIGHARQSLNIKVA